MRLHENKNEFTQIVQTVAEEFGLETFQVEKDYFVSLFLKELSILKNNVEIVFKGGTSLSKCYKVIDRFSEDIDLTIKFENKKAGAGLRKRLKQDIVNTIKKLGMKFLNPEKVQSDRDFNLYEVEFDGIFSTKSSMVPHIIIETIVVYKPYPLEKRQVSNYILNYLKEEGKGQIVKDYELEEFEMTIQKIERTFVDKLFAICDYHLNKKYDRYSRHIYDLHMIWQSGMLNMELLNSIVDDVIKDRQSQKDRNPSCQQGAAPIEILKDIIEMGVYKNDYNNVTLEFIQKPVKYDVCIESLTEIIKQDIIPELIKEY